MLNLYWKWNADSELQHLLSVGTYGISVRTVGRSTAQAAPVSEAQCSEDLKGERVMHCNRSIQIVRTMLESWPPIHWNFLSLMFSSIYTYGIYAESNE
jgi:hypothetical protein